MNPEDLNNLNTTRTIWTLRDSDGNVVIFKVPDERGGTVIVVDAGGDVRRINKDLARQRWKEYMDNGYRISNKCIDYAMNEFHNMKRYEEIHDNDLQEMRINPSDFYKNMSNYALEA